MSTNFGLGATSVENSQTSAATNGLEDLEPNPGCSNGEHPTDYPQSGECSESVEIGRDPDLWLYRERTVALLKRYLRFSIEVGRLPSILGRELFRSKVTSYRMSSFEDAVIFVHDIERVLDQLDAFSKDLIAVIIFQDYSQDEAAEVLRCGRRTVCRQFPETLDQISERFLEGGLLNRLPPRPPVENSCQEGETAQFLASACKQAE